MKLEATLGRTGLKVNKDGFGALPIQRDDMDTSIKILRKALDGGINFFDTARSYTDSEEKIGRAMSARRNEFILATKTQATKVDVFRQDLETSLKSLHTDHIDIYQFHNAASCFKPGDGTGLYEAMLKAKEEGKIRFIGITSHRLAVAREAVKSGLYDTLQFPFSYLASDQDIELVKSCEKAGMGFICMKALSGGLITDIGAARAFQAQFPGSVPIWGIQRESELDQLLEAEKGPAGMTKAQEERIARDRAELGGDFCRGCGYCSPCTVGIKIFNCARISLMLRRSPSKKWLSPEWQAEMTKIKNCTHCNKCRARCPYGLDIPALLERNYQDYQTFLK